MGELAHERCQGGVGDGHVVAQKVTVLVESCFQCGDDVAGLRAVVFGALGVVVALGVFVAIQVVFERAVVLRH